VQGKQKKGLSLLTGRPESRVVATGPHQDMLPHSSRIVPQVLPVQLDLLVRLRDERPVLRDDTVVRQEGRHHVDKVAPRKNSSRKSEIV
jgi:hypothetical protein